MSAAEIGDRSGTGPSVKAAVAAVASFWLAGSRTPRPSEPFDDEAWAAVVAACREEQLVGLLAAAVAGGAINHTGGEVGALDAALAEGRARSTRLEEDAVELSRRLDAAGIDHRFLDGPVTAHRAYAVPAHRLSSTIEVLVADGPAAAHELDDLASGRRLLLTTELLPNRLGVAVGPADLPSPADTVVVAGHPLPALPVDAHVVVACLGAGGSRRSGLRDIVQLTLSGGATVDGVTRWAAEWRVTAEVARAIRRSWEAFDLADKIGLSVWASRYESSTTEWRPRRGTNGAAHRLANALGLANRGIR
ncbi:MAG: nucleotidyltransferase family protein [Acidimicrobiales bacterium]